MNDDDNIFKEEKERSKQAKELTLQEIEHTKQEEEKTKQKKIISDQLIECAKIKLEIEREKTKQIELHKYYSNKI